MNYETLIRATRKNTIPTPTNLTRAGEIYWNAVYRQEIWAVPLIENTLGDKHAEHARTEFNRARGAGLAIEELAGDDPEILAGMNIGDLAADATEWAERAITEARTAGN